MDKECYHPNCDNMHLDAYYAIIDQEPHLFCSLDCYLDASGRTGLGLLLSLIM